MSDEHPEIAHDHFDAAPGAEELNIHDHGAGGILGYSIGLALAVGLTIASFWIGATDIVWGPSIPMALIVMIGKRSWCRRSRRKNVTESLIGVVTALIGRLQR